jgi:uncharacterized protein
VTRPGWLELPFLIAVALGPLTWALLFIILMPGLESFSVSAGLGTDPFLFLKLSLVFPIVEELAFRGYLQSRLLNHDWAKFEFSGITIANLVTSLLFCSAHAFYHPLAWSIAIILPSLLFGYFRDRYGSVIPGIVLHCFYNAGYYLLFGFAG